MATGPKPELASEYTSEDVARVYSACLSLATYLGSYPDDLVVVGGLVPTLLIPRDKLPRGAEPHVGTNDLDIGLSLALLNESRYAEIVEPLKSAGFEPDTNTKGKPANHRRVHRLERVTVDFLIAPGDAEQKGGDIRTLDNQLSAVLTPALPLAFRDRKEIGVSGKTLAGESASRSIWVCGPGAYMVLKALAFRNRGERKDAYDFFYLLQNYGTNYIADVADALRPLLSDPQADKAIAIIAEDFARADAIGPHRAAAFLGRSDPEYRTDLAGTAAELLRLVRSRSKDGKPP